MMQTKFVPDATSLSALHLCCGERTATQRVSEWLAQHAVTTCDLEDVYAASAAIVLGEIAPCQLFIAGVDWLTDNELPIVTAVAHRWPQAKVLVYTGLLRPLPAWSRAITLVRGQYELDRWLSQSPEDWVTGPLLSGATPPVMPVAEGLAGEAPSPTSAPESAGSESFGPATGQPSSTPPRAIDVPPPALTPEELAALLARE